MRTSTFARAGAVLTASALAFTLGTGPASAADDTTTTTISTVPDAQAKVDWANAGRARAAVKGGDVTPSFVANPNLTTFAYATKYQVLYKPSGNELFGTIAVTPGNPGPANPTAGYNMATNIKYYGSVKGSVPLFAGFATKAPFGGSPIPDTFGPGLYSFGPTLIDDPSGGTDFVDPTLSNTIRVRNATKGNIVYTKYYSSRKHKVTIHAQVYRPSDNIFAGGISSVRLQYKSGSTWKTYKSISLNKYGKASYTWYTSTKRTYRVLVPTTLSIQGDSDKGRYF